MPISTVVLNRIIHAKNGLCKIAGAGLFDDDMPEIITEILKNKSINVLHMGRNNVTEKSAALIASLPLVNLDISYNHLRDKGIVEIINTNQKLIWLDASDGDLTDVTAEAILANNNLVFVDISGNPRISKGMRAKVNAHVDQNYERSGLAQQEQAMLEQKEHQSITQESKSGEFSAKSSPLSTVGKFKHANEETKETPEQTKKSSGPNVF
jgi:Leucine-rich repeat (LRR) protein